MCMFSSGHIVSIKCTFYTKGKNTFPHNSLKIFHLNLLFFSFLKILNIVCSQSGNAKPKIYINLIVGDYVFIFGHNSYFPKLFYNEIYAILL